MYALKTRKIGNSVGVTLPKEALNHLQVKEGDALYLVESPEGFTLTPYDPEFDAAMQAFGETRKRYRNALHELAK